MAGAGARSIARERYSRGAIAFHWTIAALAIANLAVGFLHDPIPALGAYMGAHKAVGLTILVLTLARIAWRVTHPAPPPPGDLPAWQRIASRVTHWALYALTLLLPLTGWMMVSGSEVRRPLTWFGVFDLPYLPVGKAAGDVGHQAHVILGWLMLALVALHIAAALRHHFVLRDGVLRRMT